MHHIPLGELLASMHAKGIRWGSVMPGHAGFTDQGQWLIMDGKNLTFNQPLDPESMAADLRAPAQAYEPEVFRAFLAGYVRGSSEVIDVRLPGFTDQVLRLLGGVYRRPRPLIPGFDV